MMRYVIPYLIYSLAALACIFLQSEMFSNLQIFNAKPDLLLLVVLMSALKTDWKNGIAVGLLMGFWIDLLNGGYFGSNMVVYALIGGGAGVLGQRFPNRTYEGYFFLSVLASLLSGFLMLFVFQLVGANPPVGQSIAGIILPMTFYTSLIAFLFLPVVWIHRHRSGRKIGRIDLLGNGVIFVRGNEKVDMKNLAAYRAREKQRKMQHKREDRRRHYDKKKKVAAATARKKSANRRSSGQSHGQRPSYHSRSGNSRPPQQKRTTPPRKSKSNPQSRSSNQNGRRRR